MLTICHCPNNKCSDFFLFRVGVVLNWSIILQKTTAKKVLKLIHEISDRRKQQLKDVLKDFERVEKSASGSEKKILQDAIKGAKMELEGNQVSDNLRKSILQAIEIIGV